MLLQVQSFDKLRTRQADLSNLIGETLTAASNEPALDMNRLRVVFDWVQYKKNFRPAASLREILGRSGAEMFEIALDARRCLQDGVLTRELPAAIAAMYGEAEPRLYLEDWMPMRESCIWDFNGLYWSHLAAWEAASGRGYESTLPGGASDGTNDAAARESILTLFDVWDQLAERRALPEQLYVLELGVGNGNQARVWLDAFLRLDRERGREYYHKLHYLLADYSPHLLEIARANVREHDAHVSALVVDAVQPSTALAFARYKLFFVYISNVYDNLPTDEIARIDGRLYLVQTRAFLARDAIERIAAAHGAVPEEVHGLLRQLLRLGPELLAEALPHRFPTAMQAVQFWQAAWDAIGLEERYFPLLPSDAYHIAPRASSELLRSVIEFGGDTRMHVSNGAVASFIDTLPLLHPHGMLQCHDIIVTDATDYQTSFRGPGKYEGSVVNWVNGTLLEAVGGRLRFDVSFRPFAHRSGSNVTTMDVRVRE